MQRHTPPFNFPGYYPIEISILSFNYLKYKIHTFFEESNAKVPFLEKGITLSDIF